MAGEKRSAHRWTQLLTLLPSTETVVNLRPPGMHVFVQLFLGPLKYERLPRPIVDMWFNELERARLVRDPLVRFPDLAAHPNVGYRPMVRVARIADFQER
jgi:hypothetical protein